jgi:hypothetical protein
MCLKLPELRWYGVLGVSDGAAWPATACGRSVRLCQAIRQAVVLLISVSPVQHAGRVSLSWGLVQVLCRCPVFVTLVQVVLCRCLVNITLLLGAVVLMLHSCSALFTSHCLQNKAVLCHVEVLGAGPA